jgi:hypothetical protein
MMAQEVEDGNGGEGGIRTPGTVTRTSHFECDAIDQLCHLSAAALGLGMPPLSEVPLPCQPPMLIG